MDTNGAITAVRGIWARRSVFASLVSWLGYDAGERHGHAREFVRSIVQATRDEIPWRPIEEPECVTDNCVLACARAESEEGHLLMTAKLSRHGAKDSICVDAEWFKHIPRQDDHDELARALDAAQAFVLALVESPSFGAGSAAALQAIKGVVVAKRDAKSAFDVRVTRENSASERLEIIMGTINGIRYARPDYRHWNEAVHRALEPIGDMLRRRVPSPWDEVLLQDLKIVLCARTFKLSSAEKDESPWRLAARLEQVLALGGIVIAIRGRRLDTATLVVCPGLQT